MRYGKKKVDQVLANGNVVKNQYDTILFPTELYGVLKDRFPGIKKEGKRIVGDYKGNKYTVRVLNVCFLGGQHLSYKKRIELPDDIKDFYDKSKEDGYEPLMIGVYTYETNILFVEYSLSTYMKHKINHSAAHVHVSDLVAAMTIDDDEDGENESGYFQKADYRGNKITVFKSDPESIQYFFEERFYDEDKLDKQLEEIEKGSIVGRDNSGIVIQPIKQNTFLEKRLYHYHQLSQNVKENVKDFFDSQDHTWYGKKCYDEMWRDKYRNQNQAEWPGYYLEYRFEKYIAEKNLGNLFVYVQDKKKGGIDLDLYLPDMDVYADLKAHSSDQKSIPGNDTLTVSKALEEKGAVLYIICEHDTVKDSDCDYEVTEYWNSNKTNRKKRTKLRSYETKMKNKVFLKKLIFLTIDKSNYEKLSVFRQGKNSNGKARKVKIMINTKDFPLFKCVKYDLK